MPESTASGGASEAWPPEGCPPLAWPDLATDTQRLDWYRAVVAAYAALWEGHVTMPMLMPVPAPALDALGHQLGHRLPPALRGYHQSLGALTLAETLRSADPDGDTPLALLTAAWPALGDMPLSDDERALAAHLVVFGDYLGNGNHFCYDARDGVVWYFDHDGARSLVRAFDDVSGYLDALMLLTLAEVYEDDAAGEALIRERHGDAVVDTWRY